MIKNSDILLKTPTHQPLRFLSGVPASHSPQDRLADILRQVKNDTALNNFYKRGANHLLFYVYDSPRFFYELRRLSLQEANEQSGSFFDDLEKKLTAGTLSGFFDFLPGIGGQKAKHAANLMEKKEKKKKEIAEKKAKGEDTSKLERELADLEARSERVNKNTQEYFKNHNVSEKKQKSIWAKYGENATSDDAYDFFGGLTGERERKNQSFTNYMQGKSAQDAEELKENTSAKLSPLPLSNNTTDWGSIFSTTLNTTGGIANTILKNKGKEREADILTRVTQGAAAIASGGDPRYQQPPPYVPPPTQPTAAPLSPYNYPQPQPQTTQLGISPKNLGMIGAGLGGLLLVSLLMNRGGSRLAGVGEKTKTATLSGGKKTKKRRFLATKKRKPKTKKNYKEIQIH